MTYDLVTQMMPHTLSSLGDVVGDDLYDVAKGPALERFVPIDEFEGSFVGVYKPYDTVEQYQQYREQEYHILLQDLHEDQETPIKKPCGNFETGYEDFILDSRGIDVSGAVIISNTDSFRSSSRNRIDPSIRRVRRFSSPNGRHGRRQNGTWKHRYGNLDIYSGRYLGCRIQSKGRVTLS